MRVAWVMPLSIAAILATGCEDGPDQIFRANEGDPAEQNGEEPGPPWVITTPNFCRLCIRLYPSAAMSE